MNSYKISRIYALDQWFEVAPCSAAVEDDFTFTEYAGEPEGDRFNRKVDEHYDWPIGLLYPQTDSDLASIESAKQDLANLEQDDPADTELGGTIHLTRNHAFTFIDNVSGRRIILRFQEIKAFELFD